VAGMPHSTSLTRVCFDGFHLISFDRCHVWNGKISCRLVPVANDDKCVEIKLWLCSLKGIFLSGFFNKPRAWRLDVATLPTIREPI
jgi:hypothetical protein